MVCLIMFMNCDVCPSNAMSIDRAMNLPGSNWVANICQAPLFPTARKTIFIAKSDAGSVDSSANRSSDKQTSKRLDLGPVGSEGTNDETQNSKIDNEGSSGLGLFCFWLSLKTLITQSRLRIAFGVEDRWN